MTELSKDIETIFSTANLDSSSLRDGEMEFLPNAISLLEAAIGDENIIAHSTRSFVNEEKNNFDKWEFTIYTPTRVITSSAYVSNEGIPQPVFKGWVSTPFPRIKSLKLSLMNDNFFTYDEHKLVVEIVTEEKTEMFPSFDVQGEGQVQGRSQAMKDIRTLYNDLLSVMKNQK